MIKITIVTPKGTIFDNMVNYIVIDGNAGQMGILENHEPVIVPVKEGFIKAVINEVEFYYYLSGAILEQNKNIVTVIAQEAVNGSSIENAKENFEKERLNRKKDNQQKLIDFTKLEKDLAKSIKEINAGSL
jgi:F-type H+-transporting ATPase subunit epsilon